MSDKIYDANDRALEEHQMLRAPYTDHRQRITALSARITPSWKGNVVEAPTVEAYIDHSRWSAACECGGREYVTPADPIFFCHSCGNSLVDRSARKVIFPPAKEREKIEKLLLARPIQLAAGRTPIDQARGAVALIPGLDRSWNPGTTVKELEIQNKEAGL